MGLDARDMAVAILIGVAAAAVFGTTLWLLAETDEILWIGICSIVAGSAYLGSCYGERHLTTAPLSSAVAAVAILVMADLLISVLLQQLTWTERWAVLPNLWPGRPLEHLEPSDLILPAVTLVVSCMLSLSLFQRMAAEYAKGHRGDVAKRFE